MPSTYIDCFQYSRAPTGLQQLLPLFLGNTFRFTAQQLAGSNALSVPASAIAVQLNPYDPLTIYDGLNSEVALVAQTTSPGATSIPLIAATLFTHNSGVAVSSPGVQGDLGQCILSASAEMETICKQILWQSSYSGETLRMPSMRASIDNQQNLVFRPRNFPVTIEAGITIESSVSDPVQFDQTQCIIDSGRQIVSVPWLAVTGAGQGEASTYSIYTKPARTQNLWLKISYTAGWQPLPYDLFKAAWQLTSIILAQQFNPIGAAEISQGHQSAAYVLKGDTSGEVVLYKTAKKILDAYTVQAY